MRRHLAILAAALAVLALPGIVAAVNIQAVEGRVIPGHGTLLVASSNQLTLYTFDRDVAGSGVSTCTGQCLVNWPALTVTAGDIPIGGPGVTGTLGTILRTDNGAAQVTYNGLPLYFFINDKLPGDTNGIYPNWRAIVLAAEPSPSPSATASAQPSPTASAAPTQEPAPTEPPLIATPPPTTTTRADGSASGSPLPLLLVIGGAMAAFAVAARRFAPARR